MNFLGHIMRKEYNVFGTENIDGKEQEESAGHLPNEHF